jgi:hypothetical protein
MSDIYGQGHVTQERAATALTANSKWHSPPSEIEMSSVKPEAAFPCSQEPAIGPYPEPDESRPHISTYFLKIHFNNTIPFMPRSPFRFPGQNCVCTYVSPMFTTKGMV